MREHLQPGVGHCYLEVLLADLNWRRYCFLELLLASLSRHCSQEVQLEGADTSGAPGSIELALTLLSGGSTGKPECVSPTSFIRRLGRHSYLQACAGAA